jgi:hypothetical protein
VCVKACKRSPGLVFRRCLAGWLAGCPLQLFQSRFVTPAAGVKPRSRGMCCLFSHPFRINTSHTASGGNKGEEIYVHFRYDASLLCRRSHQEEEESLVEAPPFKHLPCGRVVLCPTGPKLGSKLILSLSLCVAVSNL